VSRVVERRFVFGVEEKEKFRTLMRMMENFSGCRVLSYCLMCNHIHILLEVPAMAEGGLSDAKLLKRLSVLYIEAFVGKIQIWKLPAEVFGGNPRSLTFQVIPSDRHSTPPNMPLAAATRDTGPKGKCDMRGVMQVSLRGFLVSPKQAFTNKSLPFRNSNAQLCP